MVYKRFFILSLLVSFGVFSTFSMHKNNRRKSKEPTEFMDNFASKKESSFDQEKGDSFEDTASLPRTHEYVQLKVFNQYSILGGDASCGYHALKNGLLIARLLLEGDSIKGELEQKLLSKELIDQLFSQRASPWRTYIIESRARHLAASYIRDVLLKSMLGVRVGNDGPYALNLESHKVSFEPFKENAQENEAEREALQGILSTISQQMASIKGVRENNLLKYELNLEFITLIGLRHLLSSIKDTFSSILAEAKKDPDSKMYKLDKNISTYRALTKKEKISRYFPNLNNFSFSVQDDNVILSPKQEVLYTYTYAGGLGKLRPEWNKSSALGQWLETEEIKALYAFEKERNGELIQGLEDNPDLPFYGMFYIEDALHNPIKNQFETNEQLLYLINEMRSSYSSFIAGLIIHQAEGEHWFTCVIKKDPSKILYVFADSANTPRINDIHVRNVIKILNGQEPIEQSRKAPQQAEPKEAESSSSNTAKPQPSAHQTENKQEDFAQVFYKANQEEQDTPSGVSEGIPSLKLEDIIGVPLEVKRIVQALSNPTPRNSVYALLLHGPPGTGKTELAHAIAGSTGREIFSIYASSIIDKYIGSGPKTIRMLFAQARQARKPAIVFIDEIDLITGKNEADHSDSHSYQETRIALHAELDKKDPNIFFVAATNHLDKIDSTICDRLADFTIKMDLPKRDQRKQILALYARKNKIEIAEAILNKLADATEGLSGRVLEKMIRKAVTLADLRDSNNFQVTEHDLYSALYSSDERMPQQAQRKAMLRHFTAGQTAINNEDYGKLAILTAGLSGATIEKLVNQAYELSQSEDTQEQISLAHFYIALYSFNPKNIPDNGIRRILLSHFLTKRNVNINAELLEKLVQKSEGLDQLQLEKVLLKALRYADTRHQPLMERDFIVALFAKYTKKIPNQDERREILNFYLQDRTLRLPGSYALDFIIRHTDEWAKAQIKKLAYKAYTLAQETGRSAIEEADLYIAQILVCREMKAAAQQPEGALTKEGMQAVLEYYTRRKQLRVSPNFFNTFARSIPREVTFDQIINLISQAELIAQRRASPIEDGDFQAAFCLLSKKIMNFQERETLFNALIRSKTTIENNVLQELLAEMTDLTANQVEEMVRKAEEIARQNNQGQLNITRDHLYIALYSIHSSKIPSRQLKLVLIKHFFLKHNSAINDALGNRILARAEGLTGAQLQALVDKSLRVAKKRNRNLYENDILIATCLQQRNKELTNETDTSLLLNYYLIGKPNDIPDGFLLERIGWVPLKNSINTPSLIKLLVKQAQRIAQETGSPLLTRHDLLVSYMKHMETLKAQTGNVKHIRTLIPFTEATLIVFTRQKKLNVDDGFLQKLSKHIIGYKIVMSEKWKPASKAQSSYKHEIISRSPDGSKLVRKYGWVINVEDIVRIIQRAEEASKDSTRGINVGDFRWALLMEQMEHRPHFDYISLSEDIDKLSSKGDCIIL